ncbi:DUF2271 domain-containing protein [Massilia sp. PWRC2]|uniref:DUF2271 domain-containing protein n=1 Tax=Massilia sp. PWRC2 TaxID=2804626 RepID=UPI003CE8E821
MKNLISTACLAGTLALPAIVQARPVILTAQLQNYGGSGAYLAVYLTDAAGNYRKTVWVAGSKVKYYRHLSDWARGSGLGPAQFDGISGASVGSGKTLKVSVELADVLTDAGYDIRIDSAVEDGRDTPQELRAPLGKQGSGKPVAGRGIVTSFTYDM